MAQVNRGVERIAAHQAHPGTIMHAERLMLVSAAVLARHRDQGNAYVEVSRGWRADAFVELVDPGKNGHEGNAIAIEFGRPAGSERGASQGVYALGAAMGARGG